MSQITDIVTSAIGPSDPPRPPENQPNIDGQGTTWKQFQMKEWGL